MLTELVTDHLKNLSKLYMQHDDMIRANTFSTAALNILEKYPENFPDNINEVKNIRGIGPSTINEINEYIKTGTSSRLEELKKIPLVNTEEINITIKNLQNMLKL